MYAFLLVVAGTLRRLALGDRGKVVA
jgi:hypothetical protein